MLKVLSDRPGIEKLERYVQVLLEGHSETLEFVVLFGSMARGDWSIGSDYDLLIGLNRDDEKRLIDRMAEYCPPPDVDIEVLPYARSEWQRMFAAYHPLILEALESGVVLWDRGGFGAMREEFRGWRETDQVQPWRMGWRIREHTD